jgi:hypothetical protein
MRVAPIAFPGNPDASQAGARISRLADRKVLSHLQQILVTLVPLFHFDFLIGRQ